MRQGSKFNCVTNCYNPLPSGKPDLTSPYDLSDPGWVGVFTFRPTDGEAVVLRSDDTDPLVAIEPDNDAAIVVNIPGSLTEEYQFLRAKYETELIPPSGPDDKMTLDTGTIELEHQVSHE